MPPVEWQDESLLIKCKRFFLKGQTCSRGKDSQPVRHSPVEFNPLNVWA